MGWDGDGDGMFQTYSRKYNHKFFMASVYQRTVVLCGHKSTVTSRYASEMGSIFMSGLLCKEIQQTIEEERSIFCFLDPRVLDCSLISSAGRDGKISACTRSVMHGSQ